MVTAHASALLPGPGWIHGNWLPCVISCIAAIGIFMGTAVDRRRFTPSVSQGLCLGPIAMFGSMATAETCGSL